MDKCKGSDSSQHCDLVAHTPGLAAPAGSCFTQQLAAVPAAQPKQVLAGRARPCSISMTEKMLLSVANNFCSLTSDTKAAALRPHFRLGVGFLLLVSAAVEVDALGYHKPHFLG